METDTISKNGASSKNQVHSSVFLRKLLLFGLLCLLFDVTMFAEKGRSLVTVISGDVSVIKNPSLALLEIDFSEAYVGDETMEEYKKRRGDNFIRDWPEAVSSTYISFTKFFNKKNKKGIQLTTEAKNVTYRMVIKVTYLNMGDTFSTLIPYSSRKAGGMQMSGTIDMIDMKTNKIVCSLNFEGVKGIGLPHVYQRLQSTFNYLADNIYLVN